MIKPFTTILLLAALIPATYFVFVFINFERVTSQDWFYSDTLKYSKAAFLITLTVSYICLIKNTRDLAAISKRNWCIAVVIVGPITMPVYWFKYAWPAVNR